MLDRVMKSGAWSEEQAKVYFRQILLATAHAHARGVAHRDMKPENLLFDTAETTCKVCDFGTAKYVCPAEGTATTKEVGTFAYMAPEVMDPDVYEYDPFKADMWSCGATLFVMVEGKWPFGQTPDLRRMKVTIHVLDSHSAFA